MNDSETIHFNYINTNINKNGAHCRTMAPFGFVTPTGQIPNHFMQNLNKLAYLCKDIVIV